MMAATLRRGIWEVNQLWYLVCGGYDSHSEVDRRRYGEVSLKAAVTAKHAVRAPAVVHLIFTMLPKPKCI